MPTTTTTLLPKKYHAAVERWRDLFIPDFHLLIEHWDRFFPNDQEFRLCAHRECGMCGVIECGTDEGKPKFTRASEMVPEQAGHVLGAIRAQASTEFGSIQQHQLTLARAQDEQDQFWVLRMMAEELRHGYQMLHLLLEDDWGAVSGTSGEEVVEETLSMRTGSHILGAFNIDFDSFVDNIVFCGLIDRVGKYQLAMQKVSAYQPMAESMPQMLREEAFHLATGVVPMRRWAEQAARGEVYVTMGMLQKTINKWFPRALEMFGHEKGGGTNVRFGLKPMKNREAQEAYAAEVQKVVTDLNRRYLRARVPDLSYRETTDALERIEAGEVVHGVAREDLIHLPDLAFYRRRGLPAFRMVGWSGEVFEDADAYVRHLTAHLPEQYAAGRDFRGYVELLRKVQDGEMDAQEASRQMPNLSRVGGVCPCSRAVRWVVDEEPAGAVAADGNGSAG